MLMPRSLVEKLDRALYPSYARNWMTHFSASAFSSA